MKISSLKWALSLGICAMAGVSMGQMYPNNPPPLSSASDTNRVAETRTSESKTFCTSKELVGANVKDSQGNKLGDIDEVLINPQNGATFASIEVSGKRYAIVPIQQFTVTRPGGLLRNADVSFNGTKQTLESGPSIASHERNNLDSPTFVQSVYSHYGVQSPSAMGGVGSGSMGGAATGSDSHDMNQPAKPKPNADR